VSLRPIFYRVRASVLILLNSKQASLSEIWEDGSETDLFFRLVPVINE